MSDLKEPLVVILEGYFLVDGIERRVDAQINLNLEAHRITAFDDAVQVQQLVENGVPTFKVAVHLGECKTERLNKSQNN